MTMAEVAKQYSLTADTLLSAGISVEMIIEYVKLFHHDAETISECSKLLLELREQFISRICKFEI